MRPLQPFPKWTWARRLTALFFLALIVAGGRGELAWFRGSLTGTTAFGYLAFTDPLVALETTLASRSWMPDMLIGAGLVVVLAVVAGPVFCAWLCPLGLVFDLFQAPRRWWRRRQPGQSRDLGLPRGLKYVALGGALAFSLIAHQPIFQALSPIQGLVRVLLFGVDAALWLVVALVVLELLVPRLWCRSLCPLGALYSVLGRRGLFRIRIDPEQAGKLKCQRCEAACPMGIRVMRDFTLQGKLWIDHPDCTRCGACTEHCPKSVLRLGLR